MAQGRGFSSNIKANLNKTSGGCQPVICISISNEFLAEPINLVRDNCDFSASCTKTPYSNEDGISAPLPPVTEFFNFIACPFDIELPNDFDKQDPTTQLKIDNVHGTLGHWIERTDGARETRVRMMVFMRNAPDVCELDCCFEVKQISITQQDVTMTLGYTRTLNLRVAGVTYSKFYFPGLY